MYQKYFDRYILYLCRKARSESKPQNLCTLHNLFVKKHNSKCMYNCFKKFLLYCSAPLEIDSCIRKGVTQMLISRHLWRQVKCHRITDYKPVVLFPLQSLESYNLLCSIQVSIISKLGVSLAHL